MIIKSFSYVVMIKLCSRTSCLKICYYAAKVQLFVFIHNASLFETAKMYCEAAIYSIEAIIGIPLFIIILSTLTDK
ncbi:hypothetical protein DXD46_04565 [Phocaeicola vulgatus]|uniref:Uncharacterized protein n=1 Tax=Phocaeicola vulgatus TaxID=821 RepID=A0A3E4JUA6_PHOVU|nr:hypothetical protein DXD46_04565 [Phocaeicola vulgatus]